MLHVFPHSDRVFIYAPDIEDQSNLDGHYVRHQLLPNSYHTPYTNHIEAEEHLESLGFKLELYESYFDFLAHKESWEGK